MRDSDVRQSVWRWLEEVHHGDSNTLMLDELSVQGGATRVDVAVINGEIVGYELKSAKDTLERLPRQIKLYGQVFDRVSLVVSENHADAARGCIPQWWGIVIAKPGRQEVSLAVERESATNPNICSVELCSFLWRDEALAILEARGAAKGVRGKARHVVYQRLAQTLSLDDIRDEVRRTLKVREGWRVDRRLRRCDGLARL